MIRFRYGAQTLKYFVAVAEELHFGRAAKRVHIAQPPLSQQIRQLEDEIGAPLFFRNNHKVELTPAGESLLPYARDILERAKSSVEAVQQSARGEAGVLVIGYVEEAVHFVFPYVMKQFKQLYPGAQVRLLEMHSRDQVDALDRGAIDFAFGYSCPDDSRIRSRTILSGPVVLALPESHELAAKSRVDLSGCSNETFIFPVRESSPNLYDFLLSVCHDNGLVPVMRYNAEHIYTVMGLVRSGLGLTLIPQFLKSDNWPGVAFRAIKGTRAALSMHVLWRSQHTQWELHRNFLRVLDEAFVVKKAKAAKAR